MSALNRRSARPGRRMRVAVAAVAIALTASACGGGSQGAEGEGGDTFVYADGRGPTSFDPIKSPNPFLNLYLNPVYDRLVHIEANGDPIPWLAESWEWSED